MDGMNLENGTAPIVVTWDRRTERRTELSSAEVMKILRKRAAKAAIRESSDSSAQYVETR